MYNHYQKNFDYITVGADHAPPPHGSRDADALPPRTSKSGSLQQLLAGITGTFKAVPFDTGDVLLILILLFLLLEGDNLELVLTLGLVLLLGLGDSDGDLSHPAT